MILDDLSDIFSDNGGVDGEGRGGELGTEPDEEDTLANALQDACSRARGSRDFLAMRDDCYQSPAADMGQHLSPYGGAPLSPANNQANYLT